MEEKKDFDCVEMKNQAQAQIYEIIKGMTIEEQLEYWRKRSVELKELKDRKKQEPSE